MTPPSEPPPAPSAAYLTSVVQRAAGLLAKDPGAAEQHVAEVLRHAPHDPRARLILASAHRRLGRPGAARDLLEPLARAHPNAANTQYELGAALADLGELGPAAEALERAVVLNPGKGEAWRLLGDLRFAAGDAAAAERAFAGHDRANLRDPRLRSIADAFHAGESGAAEQALQRFLTVQPNHAEGLRMLGELRARQGRHGDAEILLEHALKLGPSDAGVRFSYATALLRQQKMVHALPHAEALLQQRPGDPACRNLMAACLALTGDNDRVLAYYTALTAEFPKHPAVWLNYGHALRTVGRQEEAVAAYRTCLTLAPTLGEAYWSLANLKVVSFTAEEEAAMIAAAGRDTLSSEDRLHLHFALGKALEDRKDYAASYSHYAQGARIRRADAVYDPEETSDFVRRAKALFTPAFLDARTGVGHPSPAPIFIVGLPRAGSTLVEQILASHPDVEGTMELPEINLIAREVGAASGDSVNSFYPGALEALPLEHFATLGEHYLRDTAVYRKLGRPRFIDKMPNNFQHVGLIRLILPNARIIDVRRSPMASCFSAFKQHFNQGQTFSYDFDELGRYYRDYVELLDHFDTVLPGQVHRIVYEELVEDAERQIRRLLDHCGLPFDARCLRFHETERAVRTVSSEQVRRPIFRDGLEQWRNYEAWMEPLKAALGDVTERWRGG